MTGLLEAALLYAAKGWRVVPVVPSGKRPMLDDWPTKASTDPAVIRAWWRTRPEANVGLVCDRGFGFALDVDDPTVLDIMPELPRTLASTTPSGGRHFVFRHPADGELDNGNGRLLAYLRGLGWTPKDRAVDVRGRHGQIVVAPSVRDGGRVYRWDDPEAPIADAPAWLVEAIRGTSTSRRTTSSTRPVVALVKSVDDLQPQFLAHLASVVMAPLLAREGGRGSAAYKAAAALGEQGHDHADVEAALLAACEANGLVGTDGDASVRREIGRGWAAGNTRRSVDAPVVLSALPAADRRVRHAARLAALHYQYLGGALVWPDTPAPDEHLRFLVDFAGLSRPDALACGRALTVLRASLSVRLGSPWGAGKTDYTSHGRTGGDSEVVFGARRNPRRNPDETPEPPATASPGPDPDDTSTADEAFALVGLAPSATSGLRGYLRHLGGDELERGGEAAGLYASGGELFVGCLVFLWHDESGRVAHLTGHRLADNALVTARLLPPPLPFGHALAVRLHAQTGRLVAVVADELVALAALVAGRPAIALGRTPSFTSESVARALDGRPALVIADHFDDPERARHLANFTGARYAPRTAA